MKAIKKFGVGIGGPPLLNGYTNLYRELEEQLAALQLAFFQWLCRQCGFGVSDYQSG